MTGKFKSPAGVLFTTSDWLAQVNAVTNPVSSLEAGLPGGHHGLNKLSIFSHQQRGAKISPDLFSLFFEDIIYAADGGLYAEQVQNSSFEYNPTERREWHPLSF